MRRSLQVTLAALALAVAASAAPRHLRKGEKTMPSPFVLVLAEAPGPALRAELKNVSAKPQVYLHDDFHQPSRLLLRGPDGKPVPARDDRKIKKRDNALDREAYETAAPGASDSLYESEFVREDDGYSLQWGSLHFEGLKPGAYQARLQWASALDEWTGGETGDKGREKDIWKGKLESAPVTIRLP